MTKKRSLQWQKVPVELKNGSDENHYDDNLKYHAERDLQVQPGEQVAMFYGLEVISGDAYQVKEGKNNTKIMVPTDDEPVRKRVKKDTTSSDAVKVDVRKAEVDGDSKNKKRKKKDKQKKKSKDDKAVKESLGESATDVTVDNEHDQSKDMDITAAVSPEQSAEIEKMQMAWITQTGGVVLHDKLCSALVKQNFYSPTPIQAATLPAAIMGRRNIVGAAPTGSGKTLAFLLPILQSLLEQKQAARILQALIVAPTRELAMQIHAECEKLLPNTASVIVGGLAHVKQARVLQRRRPPIVIGTPGRLWDLISSGDYDHLNDLSQIRFLVIDEADRMVQQGSFPQLTSILEAVQRANPLDDSDDEESVEVDEDENGENTGMDRLLGLPGVPGEARLVMLDDELLSKVDAMRDSTEPVELDEDEEVEESDSEQEEVDHVPENNEEEEDVLSLPIQPPVHRQTFVFSATLTLPHSGLLKLNKKGKKNSKHHNKHNQNSDDIILQILEKSKAKGQTKVIDMSKVGKVKNDEVNTTNKEKKNAKSASEAKPTTSQFSLPPGLTLKIIKCTQKHKDHHLYAYLTSTPEGSSGPALVFCNSIAAVRRVGATLQLLGFDVRMLHAKMQQRARLKSVESLAKKRAVVVATDVAARGLDIPSVSSVVHYDMPRTVDSFVHRSGRTARGMGERAVGNCLALVSSGEDKSHATITRALNASFEDVDIDGRLLKLSQERVALASKIISVEESEQRVNSKNKWIKEQAKEAGLDVDDDILESRLVDGDDQDRQKFHEARKARAELKSLLSQPMQAQKFGKFLSTMSIARQQVAAAPIVNIPYKSRKKRRKK